MTRERDYIPLPTFDVDTPLGPLYIVTRGGVSGYKRDAGEPEPIRTAGAMTYGARHDAPASHVTINGVDYSLRVELADYGDGWELAKERNGSTYHAVDGMRASWTNYNDAHLSLAARRKVTTVLVPWLIEWLGANPDAIADGEHASRNDAARIIEGEIAKKRDELAELEARLAAIES